MPLLYGEGGEKAFQRLQEEILRYSDDHTVFAWKDDEVMHPWRSWRSSLLARHPKCFAQSRGFVPCPRPHGDSSIKIMNTGIEIRLWRVGPDAIYTGDRSWAYALNCTSELRRKGSIVHFLRRLEHSAGAYGRVNRHKLGYSESVNSEIVLLVSMDRAEELKRQIWPDAVVYLERGPESSKYPIVNVVSAQYRRGYEEREEVINAPILRTHTDRNFPMHNNRLNQLYERAREMEWTTCRAPGTYRMPIGGDLIAVALEYRMPCSRRLIIMIGTSVKYDVGFDCILLSENDQMFLEDCGKYYDPKIFGDQCVLSSYIVQVCGYTELHDGLRTTKVSIVCGALEPPRNGGESLERGSII